MAARAPLYVAAHPRPSIYGVRPAYVAARHPIGSNTPIGLRPYVGRHPYVGLKGYVARPFVTSVRNEALTPNGRSDLSESRNSVNGIPELSGQHASAHRGGTPQ